MTENERTAMFAALADISRQHPQWRLGQLVANVAGWANEEIWDIEDEQLLAAAKVYLSGFATAPEIGSLTNQSQQLTGAV